MDLVEMVWKFQKTYRGKRKNMMIDVLTPNKKNK